MENEITNLQIENKIIILRDKQVMIDSDLAELYGVETKRLNDDTRPAQTRISTAAREGP